MSDIDKIFNKNPRSKLRGIGAARQQTGSTQQAAGNASRKRLKVHPPYTFPDDSKIHEEIEKLEEGMDDYIKEAEENLADDIEKEELTLMDEMKKGEEFLDGSSIEEPIIESPDFSIDESDFIIDEGSPPQPPRQPNASSKDVAVWMKSQSDDEYLYQNRIVKEIVSEFGEKFTYRNQHSNRAIVKCVPSLHFSHESGASGL
jgi:hypothetical protein